MRIILVCLVVFFLVFFSLGRAFAHSSYFFPEVNPGQVNEALGKIVPIRFLPSHPLYFSIRIKETFARMLKPTAEKKASFDFIVAGKRIKETYLLFLQNDLESTNKSLASYGLQLEKFNSQFEKAKSQNKDVTQLTMETAEGLRDQEMLLSAIFQKSKENETFDELDVGFDDAFSNFGRSVFLVNEVKPGLKDRFKSILGN